MSGVPSRVVRVEHDGLVLDAVDEGPVEGTPVVLLHGFPERAGSWRLVAPLLHARGLRTVALDQRGYAPGARPRRRRDYRLPLLVEDAATLVRLLADQHGGPVHVVGHDWGAIVAWSLAVTHPDLVATLTAVSVPHPAAFLRAALRSDQALRSRYFVTFNVPGLVEWVAAHRPDRLAAQLRRTGMTEDDLARFRAEVVDDGALRGGLMWYRALPLSLRSVGGRVRVPTTFVWSDGDVAVARWGAEHTAQFVAADYELVVLEGVTHWIPTQAPQALAEAVLERVGSGSR